MKISRRDYLKTCGLASATLFLSQIAKGDTPFVMVFSGANDTNIQQVVYGKPFTSTQPRGPLGTNQAVSAFRRQNSFGALTNVEFVTIPFVMPSSPLRLNIDVLHGTAALTRGAYAMVEVLNDAGVVISGFEREKSLIANVNSLDHILRWNSQTSAPLVGRTVSLRFLLRDALLYALHTQDYVQQTLKTLTLKINRTSLVPWQVTDFSLRGQSDDGTLVTFDSQIVSLEVSNPALVITKIDKRDVHKGKLTVFQETATPQSVSVQATVNIGGQSFQSNTVNVTVNPTSETFTEKNFKLLFIQPTDAMNVVGEISFQPNTLQYYADTQGLPTTPKAMTLFNRKIDNEYYVWGSSRRYNGSNGQVFRAKTTDGINFTTYEPVVTTMNPQNFLDMTYSPTRNEYIAFERAFNPHRWFVHKSSDGLNFTNAGLAYHDFDGMELTWDAANNQYVAFQLSFQALNQPRRYLDNLGAINAGNRGRRIFIRRTSPDGVNWSPDNDVYQDQPSTWIGSQHYSIVPDSQDPPDYECYWLNVFPYGGRYMGIIMWYAVAPPNFLAAYPYDPPPSKHGPHVKTEWIVSSDLRTWERPFRNFKAAEDLRLYFSHAPIVLHDRIMFLAANQNYNLPPNYGAEPGQNIEVYGLQIDRIVSASGSAGTNFSTKQFVMPSDPLHLNLTGSVSIEVLDANGQVIPGFERTKNTIPYTDQRHLRLAWSGRLSTDLAGRTVRLRFYYLNRARIYSLHT